MAVTHDDLSLRERSADVGSAKGFSLIVFCVVCGFLSFILSLSAEATRSEATWLSYSIGTQAKEYRCYYNTSGKTPLTCGLLAFLTLAIAMFTAQIQILLKGGATIHKAFTRRACFFFIAAWVSFSIAEIALMVGVSAESGHLNEWKNPRTSCLVVRQGLFSVSGVFALITVSLVAALYLTALHDERMGALRHDEENSGARRILHPSAPRMGSDQQGNRHSGEVSSK